MKQNFTLFSDYFALRDNRLTRLDPRVKALMTLAVVLASVGSSQPVFPLVAFAACLAAMFYIRIPIRIIIMRLLPVASLVAVLVLLRGILSGSTPIYGGSVLGIDVSIKAEGLAEGGLMGARVAGAISAVMLLSFTTSAPQLYAALRWFRVPKLWVEIASMVYRYVFVILERARCTILAQRARLGYTGFSRSLNSIGILGGTVFLRAFEQGEDTYRAMLARGYNGTIPTAGLPVIGAGRAFALLSALAGTGAVFVIFERAFM